MIFGSGGIVTGLDVGTTSVKAATLKHGSTGAKLVGLALAEIDSSHDWAQAAAEATSAALSRSGAGKNTPIVTAVGGPGVSVKHVTFPDMPRQALAESIRWEARKHIPFEGSDFVLDFQPLEGANGGDNGELQVLLAAVETGLLDRHVELLGGIGVEPDTVDLTPLALMNEVDEEGLLDHEALAVIELGVKSITMAVYRRGGLFFARSIPLVGKVMRPKNVEPQDETEKTKDARPKDETEKTKDARPKDETEKTKDARPKDETEKTKGARPKDKREKTKNESGGDDAWTKVLLREVRRSLTFYHNETGKQGIDKIYLTGGRALTPDIEKKMQSELAIATDILNPLKNLKDVAVDLGELESEGPRFTVALGLARRQ